jgi:hypothetical protein
VRQSPFSTGSPAPKQMKSGLLLIVIVGVVILISVMVTFLSDGSDTTQVDSPLTEGVEVNLVTVTASPSQVPAIPATTTQPSVEPMDGINATLSGVAYQSIQDAYSRLSSADWIAYARALVNRHVQWQGEVQAIHASDEIWINMDNKAQKLIPETALHLASEDQSFAPGETVTFEGDISRIVVLNRQVLVHLRNGQLVTTQN